MPNGWFIVHVVQGGWATVDGVRRLTVKLPFVAIVDAEAGRRSAVASLVCAVAQRLAILERLDGPTGVCAPCLIEAG